MLKFLLDALESVMYSNDNMIYSVAATKIRSTNNNEYTEFVVENM